MNQKQDLTVFRDNSIIPQSLIDTELHHTTMITHCQGTSPTWLVTNIIENSLYGRCTLNVSHEGYKTTPRCEVIVISFLQEEELWTKNLKKNGVDISTGITFIDSFTRLFEKVHTEQDVIRLFDQFKQTIQSISHKKKIIIVDSPDILLFGTTISATLLIEQLSKINKLASNLFIVTSSEQNSIDLGATNETSPEFKVTDFLSRMYHRSNLNFALRPLTTGRANDVTGTLSVSRGNLPYHESLRVEVIEKEYLYFITKENNVKLFFR